ncbi:C-C motif chemokine 28-like [Latimeria chalumnae]|uniref:C-C motif chemokine 28-like n=1 Tax=Latimeria chalumnae TaxID=7897 RepID=UPI0003C12733|nr:PREDICTED: C-C motif chemokine 28-like [Latimeria chalumnae]|eukprot:XP_005999079.1 PREDICTED: C-C motif chemokine 28-like [Latimeria chalumnae]
MGIKVILLFTVTILAVMEYLEAIPMSHMNCCTQVSNSVTKSLLRKVERVQIQDHDGICHMKAMVLHIKGRKLCVNPRNKLLLKWLRKNAKLQGRTWSVTNISRKEGKKRDKIKKSISM